MLHIENYSEKFSDVKKIYFHNHNDVRGSFIKVYENKEFQKVMPTVDEIYLSTSQKNVIRGIHFQSTPHQLTKVITCLSGSIVDLFIDLRKNSDTYGSFEILKLSESDEFSILIPKGFGHGFSVTTDSATLLYYQQGCYDIKFEGGIHPLSLDVDWGISESIISERDSKLPAFEQLDEKFNL
jgi:dTDP-4-dehydrorhamnose 3,5-epimerase